MIFHIFGQANCKWTKLALKAERRYGLQECTIYTPLESEQAWREFDHMFKAFASMTDEKELDPVTTPQVFLINEHGTQYIGDFDDFLNFLEGLKNG